MLFKHWSCVSWPSGSHIPLSEMMEQSCCRRPNPPCVQWFAPFRRVWSRCRSGETARATTTAYQPRPYGTRPYPLFSQPRKDLRFSRSARRAVGGLWNRAARLRMTETEDWSSLFSWPGTCNREDRDLDLTEAASAYSIWSIADPFSEPAPGRKDTNKQKTR